MNNETQHKKINILIDTCSWVNLLSKEDVNKLLPHLEFWNNNDCINLITHKVILEEWDKLKKEERDNFSKAENAKWRHTVEMGRKMKFSIPENLEPNIQYFEHQIDIIDKLLRNSTVIDVSDEIKISCADRCREKKAPFHNKQFSMSDAYFIFSTLKHFEELGQNFLFISANKNDFGAPENLETEIHPQIIEDYQNVKVRYFSNIGRAIAELRNELPISLLPEQINSEKSISIDNSIEIDKTKHILDQVYDYISFIQSEMNFYPISLLVNHYPFRTSKDSYSYYSIFSLNIDNEQLFELFRSIEITKDNTISITNTQLFEDVDDYLNKIKFVVSFLSQNLIFNISKRDTRDSVRIKFYENSECNCPISNFQAFKFVECFNNINSFPDCEDGLRKSYYLNYLIGNYVTAAEKQQALLKKLKKKTQKTQYFISQFNLSKLSRFLWHRFGESSIKELGEIDLKCEAIKHSTEKNLKLINYIREEKFYINTKDKIQISTNKLRDQYYSSLNGGWSSNSEVKHLINEFAIVESFLSNNQIVFNKFNEFNELFVTFTEGLFASHAISNDGWSSRLQEFDDWLISCLLIYGDSKTINKFHKRYKLEKINYKKTSLGDSFVDLINNFFNNDSLKEILNDNHKKINRHFWDYYDRIFKNILTLVSICNFDSSYIREFTQKLIVYLEEGYIPYNLIDDINTFLYRCGKELDYEILQKLFDAAIDNSFFHDTYFFRALFYVLNNNGLRLGIDEKKFDKVMNFVFEQCPKCGDKHSTEIIVQTYLLIDNQAYKEKISDTITQKLQEQFDFDLFYEATLFDVIPFDKNFFTTALVSSYPKEPNLTDKGIIFGVKENRFRKVDAILNLCFKLNIATNTDDFEPIKASDKYYEWLVDMDNFDYAYFDPQWIGQYGTRYYYKKFYNCKLIKKKLFQTIKEKPDTQPERDYIDIYVRKTWK